MPESYPAATIILAEVSAVLLAVFVFLFIRYMRNYRDLTQALTRLAQKFRLKRDDRLSMLKNFLHATCNYPETRAEEIATELLAKEKLFYSTILEIYRNRDNKALKNLDETTEQMIGAYRNLLSVTMESITRDVQQDFESKTRDMAATIEQLTQKNISMSDEINKLQKEMNATLSEYASAFARDQATRNATVAASTEESADNNASVPDTSVSADTVPDAPDTQPLPAVDEPAAEIDNPAEESTATATAQDEAVSADNDIQFPAQDDDETFESSPTDMDMPDTPDDDASDTESDVPSLDDIAIDLEKLAVQNDEDDNASGNSAA